MNRKFVLILICAAALGLAGLQAFAQEKPDQSTQPPPAQSNPSDQQQPANPPAQANPSDQNKPIEQQGQTREAVSDPEVAARVDARLQQLSTQLNLTDEQKTQIKPILLDASKRMQAVNNDPQRSVSDKKSKLDEIHDSARGQIRQFLTPDQSKKLDAMKAEDII